MFYIIIFLVLVVIVYVLCEKHKQNKHIKNLNYKSKDDEFHNNR